jgi:hypothetical protein
MGVSQVADPALAGSAAGVTAAQLAARIEIPRRLPPRLYDGQPLRHLSHSSYARWVVCRESWRRYYICNERSAPTGAMFLGRQVDDAITLYYRRILEHGDRLTADQVKDLFWDGWKAAAEAEREQLGIAWEDDLREERAFKLGLDAIDLSFRELIPRLGEPVAAQRKVELRIHPEAEWTILAFLDVETIQRTAAGETPVVVDYKVKTTPLSQYKADRDFQPDVYLAGRWLEGNPAAFQFAQLAKPGPKRREMSASIITTSRTVGQLRGALARIAQAASEIVACWETLGPERPWGFADPTGWKCSPRYCEHWHNCPGGSGL